MKMPMPMSMHHRPTPQKSMLRQVHHLIRAGLPQKANGGSGTVTVNTTTLPHFADGVGVAQANYVVIDTEGHEAPIIQGMGLGQEANRARFPAFQFECNFNSM